MQSEVGGYSNCHFAFLGFSPIESQKGLTAIRTVVSKVKGQSWDTSRSVFKILKYIKVLLLEKIYVVNVLGVLLLKVEISQKSESRLI